MAGCPLCRTGARAGVASGEILRTIVVFVAARPLRLPAIHPAPHKRRNVIVTARTRSLGQGNIFSVAWVKNSVHGEGSASVHAIPPGTRHPRGPGTPPPVQCMLGDRVSKRAVCILLECNLVSL